MKINVVFMKNKKQEVMSFNAEDVYYIGIMKRSEINPAVVDHTTEAARKGERCLVVEIRDDAFTQHAFDEDAIAIMRQEERYDG